VVGGQAVRLTEHVRERPRARMNKRRLLRVDFGEYV
jgi:ribosomal protein S15P/S13E